MFRQMLGIVYVGFMTAGWAGAQEMCTTQPNSEGRLQTLCYQAIDEVKTIEEVTVEPVNAGINPEFSAYLVQGWVEIGGNSCEAQGLEAQLQRETGVDGVDRVVAHVVGWRPTDVACITLYKPERRPVQLTVRGPATQIAKTLILNAETKGLQAPIDSPCLAAVVCTSQFAPAVCTFDSQQFLGGNLCEAQARVRKIACLRGMDLDILSLSCEASPVIEGVPSPNFP